MKYLKRLFICVAVCFCGGTIVLLFGGILSQNLVLTIYGLMGALIIAVFYDDIYNFLS